MNEKMGYSIQFNSLQYNSFQLNLLQVYYHFCESTTSYVYMSLKFIINIILLL